MTDLHEAARCGDYCGKCPKYPDRCRGCIPSYRPDCHFIRCCEEKAMEHCGLGSEFPCRKLADFVPDNSPGCPKGYHLLNLRERTVIGTEAWLERQRAMWKKG